MTCNHAEPRSSHVVSLAPASRLPLNVFFLLSAESEKKTDWFYIGMGVLIIGLIILIIAYFFYVFFLRKGKGLQSKV